MLVIIIELMILGIVQGVTEFIPISSSAHLIIIPWLFGWTDPALTSLSFDVALHLGTLLAVLVFFARDWINLIRAFFQSLVERRIGVDPERKLAWFVVLGTIPGGIAGVLFESKIDALFHQPGVPIPALNMLVMAAIIAGFGALLWLADHLASHLRGLNDLTLKRYHLDWPGSGSGDFSWCFPFRFHDHSRPGFGDKTRDCRQVLFLALSANHCRCWIKRACGKSTLD